MWIPRHYLALLPPKLAQAFHDDGPAVGEGEKRRQRSIALPTSTVVFAVKEILKGWRAQSKVERECRVATDKAATDGTRDLRCCRQRFVA